MAETGRPRASQLYPRCARFRRVAMISRRSVEQEPGTRSSFCGCFGRLGWYSTDVVESGRPYRKGVSGVMHQGWVMSRR